MKKFDSLMRRVPREIKTLTLVVSLLMLSIQLTGYDEALGRMWIEGDTSYTVDSDAAVGTVIGTLEFHNYGCRPTVVLLKRQDKGVGLYSIREQGLAPHPWANPLFNVDSSGNIKVRRELTSAVGTHRRRLTIQSSDYGMKTFGCHDRVDITITVVDAGDNSQRQQQVNVNPVVNPVNPQPGQRSGAQRDPETQPDPTQNTAPAQRRVIIYRCPVGWQKQNTFGHPTPKVFIRAVEVEIDRNDRSGIYKPVAIEIYADPTEGLQDLDGWKLTVAAPYSPGREYHLTAENAVFNADGIARIESPDTEPFPMRDLTSIGQVLPGFDYRLFSEKNRRVDFAISCYEGTNATLQQLETMEKPRLERTVDPTSHDWNIPFFRSQWRVPVPVAAAPAAPSLSSTQQRLTTMWASLKKR